MAISNCIHLQLLPLYCVYELSDSTIKATTTTISKWLNVTLVWLNWIVYLRICIANFHNISHFQIKRLDSNPHDNGVEKYWIDFYDWFAMCLQMNEKLSFCHGAKKGARIFDVIFIIRLSTDRLIRGKMFLFSNKTKIKIDKFHHLGCCQTFIFHIAPSIQRIEHTFLPSKFDQSPSKTIRLYSVYSE